MAAKGIQFPWRWDGSTISRNLDVIWGMSVYNTTRSIPMTRATAGFIPLSRVNFVQAIALTLLSIIVCISLVFYPDSVVEILSKASERSTEQLLESRFEFLTDIALIWIIGIIFILFDALSRNTQGAPLLRTLFFDRAGRFARGERAMIIATLFSSFLLAPALIVITLGRVSLGTDWLITEDGPLEYMTAVNFLIAASLLAYLAFRHLALTRQRVYYNVVVLLLLSLIMFFIGFEEINWGQRIVGFETPELLKRINTQDEFNIHNIFTKEVLRSYIFIAGAVFVVSCISCWFLLTDFHMSKLQRLLVYLPDPSLMVLLSFTVIFSTHIRLNDLVEQIASVVVVLYSARLALHGLKPFRSIRPNMS